MKTIIITAIVLLVFVVLAALSDYGVQILASIMTVILHPWILAPLVILAVILVLLFNNFRKNGNSE